MRIPVRLLPPDWTVGLVRSTAGSFSDYVSVSLRRDIFLMVVRAKADEILHSGADPVSIENTLPACQPDYNLPLVSCRLIFPGMRS